MICGGKPGFPRDCPRSFNVVWSGEDPREGGKRPFCRLASSLTEGRLSDRDRSRRRRGEGSVEVRCKDAVGDVSTRFQAGAGRWTTATPSSAEPGPSQALEVGLWDPFDGDEMDERVKRTDLPERGIQYGSCTAEWRMPRASSSAGCEQRRGKASGPMRRRSRSPPW